MVALLLALTHSPSPGLRLLIDMHRLTFGYLPRVIFLQTPPAGCLAGALLVIGLFCLSAILSGCDSIPAIAAGGTPYSMIPSQPKSIGDAPPAFGATLSLVQSQATQAAWGQATRVQADLDRRATDQAAPGATAEYWRRATASQSDQEYQATRSAQATLDAVEYQAKQNEIMSQQLQLTADALKVANQAAQATSQAILDQAAQAPRSTGTAQAIQEQARGDRLVTNIKAGGLILVVLIFTMAVLLIITLVSVWVWRGERNREHQQRLEELNVSALAEAIAQPATPVDNPPPVIQPASPAAQQTLRDVALEWIDRSIDASRAGVHATQLIGGQGAQKQVIRDRLRTLGLVRVEPDRGTWAIDDLGKLRAAVEKLGDDLTQ